jgi:hypothetical protein
VLLAKTAAGQNALKEARMRLEFKPPTKDGIVALTRFYVFNLVPYLGDDEYILYGTWGKITEEGTDVILQDKKNICGPATFKECEEVMEKKIAERQSIGYEMIAYDDVKDK